MFKQRKESNEDNRSDVYTPESIADCGNMDEEFDEAVVAAKPKKGRQATNQNKRKKKASSENAETITKAKANMKKRVIVADVLNGIQPQTNSTVGCDPYSEDQNDTIINMGLNRAQTLKNFIDRIRGNQSVYLPCTFAPAGMTIQCMEPGQKSWIHAELYQDGCDFYGYAHDLPTLQITLQFKEFHQLIKGADANDKIFIRVYKNDPTVVHLTLQNPKAEMKIGVRSVENEPDADEIKQQILSRISDEDDYEYKIPTNELQRKINMLNTAKVTRVKFENEGENLLMSYSQAPQWCHITAAKTTFLNTFVRGPTHQSNDDYHDTSTDEQHWIAKPLTPNKVECDVKLTFLGGICKGPSNSASSQSSGIIGLRIGNEKDMLIMESLGSFGRLFLGIRTEVE